MTKLVLAKIHMSGGMRIWETDRDYRAKATRGVALAAVMLMMPFTLYALVCQLYVVAVGGVYITAILVINTQLVARGRDHEPLTLYGLVPGGILFMALAYRVDGTMASIWCFPSILACYCMLGRRKAMLANGMILVVAAPMMWMTLDTVMSARFTASLLAVSLFASILVREIDAQQLRLKYQINHDPLTGLLNRTSLKRRMEEIILAFHDRFEPAALLTIDLDHFKNVNDRFGHDTGDLVLCEVSRLLTQATVSDGAVFRLGGEEFLILLTGYDKAAARKFAEMIRAMIAGAFILQGHQITVSIGAASLLASDDRESWSRRSDDFLYMAKHNGRNQVAFDGSVDSMRPSGPVADRASNLMDDEDVRNNTDSGVPLVDESGYVPRR